MRKATEIRGHRQPQAAELVHRADPGESRASARRVDPRYAPLLVSAIMAIVISLSVSLVETIVRLGFTSSLVPAWLTSSGVAVVVAVPTAVLVAPHAQRLVSRITRPPQPRGLSVLPPGRHRVSDTRGPGTATGPGR